MEQWRKVRHGICYLLAFTSFDISFTLTLFLFEDYFILHRAECRVTVRLKADRKQFQGSIWTFFLCLLWGIISSLFMPNEFRPLRYMTCLFDIDYFHMFNDNLNSSEHLVQTVIMIMLKHVFKMYYLLWTCIIQPLVFHHVSWMWIYFCRLASDLGT